MTSFRSINISGSYSLWIALIGLLLYSCDYSYLEGMDDIQHQLKPVIAVPLINESMGLASLLDETEYAEFEIGADDLITMIYKGRIYSLTAGEVFLLSPQNRQFVFTGIPAPPAGVSIPPQTFVYEMTLEDDESLTYVSFLQGIFTVSARSPQMAQDGYNINASVKILGSSNRAGFPITGNLSLNQPAQVNLDGSYIDFSGENRFGIEITVSLTGNGNPVNAPYDVEFQIGLHQLKYDLIKGYIGRFDFHVGDTWIPINLFESTRGSIYFEDPHIDFTVVSTFGLPVNLHAVDFYAILANGNRMDLTGPGCENPWYVNFSPTPELPEAVTTFSANHDNTNLFQITTMSPKQIYLKVMGTTNPRPADPKTNWIKHDSNLTIDVDLKLPLHGRIDYFNMGDTIDLKIDAVPEEIDWLELKLNIVNGFPLAAELNLVLLNEAKEVVDTLFKNMRQLIRPAQVNTTTGLVSSSTSYSIASMLSKPEIENLSNTHYLIIDARMKTPGSENQTSVRILDSYRLNLDLGIRAKGNVSVGGNNTNN
jgi:hypothetical protein